MKFSDDHLQRLAAYQAWNEGKDPSNRISIFDYATFTATPDLLFGFAALFFCDLVEKDGYYFIAARFDNSVYEEWKKKLTDPRAIQRVMNHLHMSNLLQSAEVDDKMARICANLLAEAWTQAHARNRLVAEVHGDSLEDLSVTLVNRD